MYYTCCTKIFTLPIAPVLSISVGILCEFSVLQDVCILLFPSGRSDALFFVKEQMYISGRISIKKIAPIVFAILLLCLGKKRL